MTPGRSEDFVAIAAFVVHIDHRDDERPPRAIGPFATREKAEAWLDQSQGWERHKFAADFWRHTEDHAYGAVVVEVERP